MQILRDDLHSDARPNCRAISPENLPTDLGGQQSMGDAV